MVFYKKIIKIFFFDTNPIIAYFTCNKLRHLMFLAKFKRGDFSEKFR